jgi:hypothetical protein
MAESPSPETLKGNSLNGTAFPLREATLGLGLLENRFLFMVIVQIGLDKDMIFMEAEEICTGQLFLLIG